MRTHRTNNQQPEQRSGVVSVEMALTLPIYFSLLFGAMEIARVNVVLHTMENAAYEGARRLIVPGATVAQGEATTLAGLTAVKIKNPTVTVTPDPLTGIETQVTVTISVPLNDNAWVTPNIFKDMTLTRSCTLNTERTVTVVE
ncbi:MAG: pilus assembly protein [Planctomycetaceae bacterium]|nr:pilus assembly protein [Planctomycetaceae bacterium]